MQYENPQKPEKEILRKQKTLFLITFVPWQDKFELSEKRLKLKIVRKAGRRKGSKNKFGHRLYFACDILYQTWNINTQISGESELRNKAQNNFIPFYNTKKK